jgi:poly(3-hydroxybutyrate) depolymerase
LKSEVLAKLDIALQQAVANKEVSGVIALPDKADDSMKCTRKTWSGGEDGREVVLIEIENGGHTWPGNEPIVAMLGKSTKDISANDLMWVFFQEHPKKSKEAVTEGIGVTLRK